MTEHKNGLTMGDKGEKLVKDTVKTGPVLQDGW